MPAITPSALISSSSITPARPNDPDAPENKNFPICLESLTERKSPNSLFPVVRAHAPQAKSTTAKTEQRQANAPLVANHKDDALSNSEQNAIDDRQHLFHYECFVEQLAHNGKQSGFFLFPDTDLRCPLCNRESKLSEITPYVATNKKPNQLELFQFRRALRNDVDNKRRTLPKPERQTETTPLHQSARQVYFGSTYGGRHGVHMRANLHTFGSRAVVHSNTSNAAEISPAEQQRLGGALLGVSLLAVAVHAPPILPIMTALLGSGALGTGTIRGCIDGHQTNEANVDNAQNSNSNSNSNRDVSATIQSIVNNT